MKITDFSNVVENASLKNYNTYKIDASCKYLVKPKDVKELQDLMIFIKENNYKYYILGRGSNVILSDNFFEGIIISLERLNEVIIKGTLVEAYSGVTLSSLVFKTIDSSLQGLENLALIPGSLGGALLGNAGAYNSTIYDTLESITILKGNKIIIKNKEDIKYSYRNTEFKNSDVVIVSAKFKLSYGKKEELLNTIDEQRRKRFATQPLEYPNAGSVFKNPKGTYAGVLIEECGLKGYNINDAYISEKHANFIVNIGSATGSDIRKLIKYIQDVVYEQRGIKLELEQNVIDW